MKEFAVNIAERIGVDVDSADLLLSKMKIITLEKGEKLSKAGTSNDNLYILCKGLLRSYLPSEDGDLTLWFAYVNQLIINIWSFQSGAPSRIEIEAVVGSELLCISKVELESLCQSSLAVCNVVRKLFEYHAIETEKNNVSQFECENGLERYIAILKLHPELLQYVPLKDLASYLQLAPQSLSRIRAQIK